MKRLLLNTLFKIPMLLLLCLTTLGSLFYLWSPLYDFESPEPFSGESIYNPYAEVDSSQWRRSNFHAHHRMWAGLTNGGCTQEELINAYQGLGYEFIGISNYQSMTDWREGTPKYIPLYEHGWGVTKFHQLVFGAEKVTWFDYPFHTTRSQMQYMLERVHRGADLITFNHPRFTRFMDLEDMKYLSGYELIEATAGMASSPDYWDAALSSGHASFICSNDDSHDINKLYQLSRNCTFVNSPSTDYVDLIASLKAGRTYGLTFPKAKSDEEWLEVRQSSSIPKVKLQMIADSVTVELSEKAKEIRFIGQDGAVRSEVSDSSSLTIVFQTSDSYLRAEALLDNGVKLYLNPLFRYHTGSDPLAPQSLHRLNIIKSFLLSFAWLLIVMVQIWMIRRVSRL
ncbi:MAG: hypothetical protein ACRC6V_09670 [Bacteroidales bacterium]